MFAIRRKCADFADSYPEKNFENFSEALRFYTICVKVLEKVASYRLRPTNTVKNDAYCMRLDNLGQKSNKIFAKIAPNGQKNARLLVKKTVQKSARETGAVFIPMPCLSFVRASGAMTIKKLIRHAILSGTWPQSTGN